MLTHIYILYNIYLYNIYLYNIYLYNIYLYIYIYIIYIYIIYIYIIYIYIIYIYIIYIYIIYIYIIYMLKWSLCPATEIKCHFVEMVWNISQHWKLVRGKFTSELLELCGRWLLSPGNTPACPLLRACPVFWELQHGQSAIVAKPHLQT